MARVRTADQLADISVAAWEGMTTAERAMVLIEHFLGGATFDPLECGFCRDSHSVLDALTQVGSDQREVRVLRAECDEARDNYRLLKRDVEEFLRRLPVDLDAQSANARLAVIASLHIVR